MIVQKQTTTSNIVYLLILLVWFFHLRVKFIIKSRVTITGPSCIYNDNIFLQSNLVKSIERDLLLTVWIARTLYIFINIYTYMINN